jgi:hypothetical protein
MSRSSSIKTTTPDALKTIGNILKVGAAAGAAVGALAMYTYYSDSGKPSGRHGMPESPEDTTSPTSHHATPNPGKSSKKPSTRPTPKPITPSTAGGVTVAGLLGQEQAFARAFTAGVNPSGINHKGIRTQELQGDKAMQLELQYVDAANAAIKNRTNTTDAIALACAQWADGAVAASNPSMSQQIAEGIENLPSTSVDEQRQIVKGCGTVVVQFALAHPDEMLAFAVV